MKLVEQHIFYKSNKRFKSLDKICFLSKNLYNYSLYKIKKELNDNGNWLRYNELEKELRTTNQNDYVALPNNSSQQILMILDTNLKTYFKALKIFKKSKVSFRGCPKFPNFKHKNNGRNIVIFTSNQFRFKDNLIYFPKKSEIEPLKTKINENVKIYQVRIVPKNDFYCIEIIYDYKEKVIINNSNYLSIDLGINNLASCITTKGEMFIINGKPLKSINQYYNKKKAYYQSKLKDKQLNSKRINNLTNKRNNKISNYLHKSSKIIIEYCKENNINNIVLGKNIGWKQEIKLGKRTNQNFVQIPFNKFESYLTYKCIKEGIKFNTREESFTSKASALDLDSIPNYNKIEINYSFSGKRIKRGLYKSKENIIINADINGSINILRKEIGDEWLKSILSNRGFVVNPIKVLPL